MLIDYEKHNINKMLQLFVRLFGSLVFACSTEFDDYLTLESGQCCKLKL